MAAPGAASKFFGNVVVRVVLYYAALVGAATWAWYALPVDTLRHLSPSGARAVDAVLGAATGAASAPGTERTATPLGAVVAMVGSVLLSLPVAWVYVLTRATRGFQQSVVQTLVILPMVVAGVVALVKDSLPLAFGLAGIVAAVRFRTALDDSKDAVYVFLATGVGLAAAVDIQVAAAVSIVFNGVVLLLWYTDFGRAPAALDGRRAERRLQRAMEQMSRTGTFVARIDNEIFQNMPPEQLHAVADRAWRRARRNSPEAPDPEGRREALLRVRTHDVPAARRTIEPMLDEQLKRWRFGGVVHEPGGVEVLEYTVLLKKGGSPEALLDALRGEGAPLVVGAQLD